MERLDSSLSPDLRVRYLFALLTIAVVATAGQALVQLTLVGQAKDYNKVRLAERQAVLSEEFGKAVVILRLSAGEAAYELQLARTDGLFRQLVQNHRMLELGDREQEIAAPESLDDLELFASAAREFRNLVVGYQLMPREGWMADAEEELLRLAAQRVNASESNYRHGLDRLTLNYMHELRAQMNWVRGMEIALLVLTLIILGVEALYVFRPAVARMLGALQARSDFLSRVGHEIRNPMNSILGMSDLLGRTPLTGQQERYLGVLNRSAHGLVDLLNHILDYSSLESGRVILESITFELERVIERVAELAALSADEKGLTLVVDLGPRLPVKVKGDPLRLQQILANLTGNAIKFTQQGEVRVVARVVDGASSGRARLEFRICDTGIGIDPGSLRRIFEGFVQEDSSIRRRFGGSGLGLSISQDLVRLMGGAIDIVSEKGKGSTFRFQIDLPVVETEGAVRTLGDEVAGMELAGTRIVAAAPPRMRPVLEPLEKLGVNWVRMIWDWIDEPGAVPAFSSGAIGLTSFERLDEFNRAGWPAERVLVLTRPTAPPALLEDLGRRGYRQILLPPRPSEFFTACRAAARGEAVPAQTSAVAAPVLALAPPQADVISLKKGVQKQVLVVDDSPENRLVIESFLEGLPCRSVSVTSGEEAVETCRQHRFDLILMDIHMPGMDGYATTRALREMERREGRKPAQIVAVTAHSEGQGTAGFKARGFDDYLPKPIDARALGMLVRVADPRTLREPVRRLADRVKLMAPDYLRDRSAELEAVAPTDLGRVGTLAHRIKGNARTFGFAPLGEMGAELEEAARQGNMPAVEAGLTRMREYLRKELSAEKTPS